MVDTFNLCNPCKATIVSSYYCKELTIVALQGLQGLKESVPVRVAANNSSFAGIAGIEGIDPLRVVVRTAAVCTGDDAALFLEDRYGVREVKQARALTKPLTHTLVSFLRTDTG